MEKQVLSIEQMQELIELGIDTSKASMLWSYDDLDDILLSPKTKGLNVYRHQIPTFTLQDILKIIKEKILKRDLSLNLEVDILNNRFNLTKEIDYRIYTSEGKSLLKAAFNMLKWCKQNNYI